MTANDPWQKQMDVIEQLNREARQRQNDAIAAELRRLLHDTDRPGTLAEALRDRIAELESR